MPTELRTGERTEMATSGPTTGEVATGSGGTGPARSPDGPPRSDHR